jgi:hypothetical protein
MTVEGFVGVVRLAWTVHLMLTQDCSSSRDISDIWSCLEIICRQNAFEFFKERVLKTAAYQVHQTISVFSHLTLCLVNYYSELLLYI